MLQAGLRDGTLRRTREERFAAARRAAGLTEDARGATLVERNVERGPCTKCEQLENKFKSDQKKYYLEVDNLRANIERLLNQLAGYMPSKLFDGFKTSLNLDVRYFTKHADEPVTADTTSPKICASGGEYKMETMKLREKVQMLEEALLCETRTNKTLQKKLHDMEDVLASHQLQASANPTRRSLASSCGSPVPSLGSGSPRHAAAISGRPHPVQSRSTYVQTEALPAPPPLVASNGKGLVLPSPLVTGEHPSPSSADASRQLASVETKLKDANAEIGLLRKQLEDALTRGSMNSMRGENESVDVTRSGVSEEVVTVAAPVADLLGKVGPQPSASGASPGLSGKSSGKRRSQPQQRQSVQGLKPKGSTPALTASAKSRPSVSVTVKTSQATETIPCDVLAPAHEGDPAVSSGASNGNHGALNHNKDVSRKSQGCQAREVILEDKCVGGGPGSGLQDDYDKSIKAPLEKRPVAPEPPVNWQGRCYISRARSDPVLRPDVGTPPGGKRKPRPLPDVDMDPHAEPYLRQVWENRQKSAALAATSVTDGSWAAAALFRSGPARSPLPPLIGSER
eukprot:TRINITY_DN2906_c0_g2_i7.p1 TRINITY_DN2906_c0_g2~~TRINITY_DN2906_c0_g2_i7.p1  ORF type:complete len:570 (-),score=81.99 TRINITY_DN2906_c0_g2_i7:195-1904(-)